jgi:hypothetical protein
MTATNTTNIHAMPRPVRMVDKYSYNELHAAAHQMDKTGGGFASAIANAYFRADSTNKAILLDAFGDLFEKFIPEDVRLDAEQEQGDLFPTLR